MKEPLTKMQLRVLRAMSKHGLAAIVGEKARKLGYGEIPALHGGIVIRAYQAPEYFLARRGLIERAERNVPGTWWRLTEKGKRAVEQRQART